jgi:hypothetical protein
VLELTLAEDPDAEAKAKLRTEALSWGIRESEVAHILLRYPLERARTILWQARRPKPDATPIEAAAD